MTSLIVAILALTASVAMAFMMYRQSENFYWAHKATIDHNTGRKMVEDGEALVESARKLRGGPRLVASRADEMSPSTPPAEKPPVDGVTRKEFNGAKVETDRRLRALDQKIDDVRASQPQGGRVEETTVVRYRVKLSGLRTEQELSDLKRRWAASCQIVVNAIRHVPGGYEFYSSDCEPEAFDTLNGGNVDRNVVVAEKQPR